MEYRIDILIVSPDGSDSLSSVLRRLFRRYRLILTGVGAGTRDYRVLSSQMIREDWQACREYILNNLYEKNKKIVVFQSLKNHSIQTETKGFQDSLFRYNTGRRCHLLTRLAQDRAELRMKDYLISHDSADIVLAFNDDVAYGDIRPVSSTGLGAKYI